MLMPHEVDVSIFCFNVFDFAFMCLIGQKRSAVHMVKLQQDAHISLEVHFSFAFAYLMCGMNMTVTYSLKNTFH